MDHEAGHRTVKILVVEDHPDMRQLLVWQMEKMGYSVTLARNGKECVEKAIEEKPEFILMDILMPGMDGREATRMLRRNHDTQDVPILATTALFRESDLKTCIEAGCDGYIVKPFRFEELKRKVEELMRIPSTTTP
jgi:CheY-like chemotaxis protein